MIRLFTFILLLTPIIEPMMLFDFNKDANISDWQVEDDRVMGGISQGQFELDKNGHGHFHGIVTVESNGGFSSVQNNSYDIDVKPTDCIAVRLKGDGHDYRIRVKDYQDTYYSYSASFKTTGEWETVHINLADMKPTYRGRDVEVPNFDKNHISQIRFLIGTKKVQEEFELLIDKIELVSK